MLVDQKLILDVDMVGHPTAFTGALCLCLWVSAYAGHPAASLVKCKELVIWPSQVVITSPTSLITVTTTTSLIQEHLLIDKSDYFF